MGVLLEKHLQEYQEEEYNQVEYQLETTWRWLAETAKTTATQTANEENEEKRKSGRHSPGRTLGCPYLMT